MKYSSFATLLLAASVAVNAGFFAGCKSLHDMAFGHPCKYSSVSPHKGDDGKERLERIAKLLNIKTSNKMAFDLESAIKDKLDRSIDVPNIYDANSFEKMAKDLNSNEEKAMREYQRFISDLQGKRVIVIEPED